MIAERANLECNVYYSESTCRRNALDVHNVQYRLYEVRNNEDDDLFPTGGDEESL